MDKLRTDKQEGSNELKLLSQKKRRSEKEKLKRNLLRETTKDISDDEDGEDMDGMNIDDENNTSQIKKKFKKRKITPEQEKELKRKEKEAEHNDALVERMKRKIVKNWNR